MTSGRLCLITVQGMQQKDDGRGEPREGAFMKEVLPEGCTFVCSARSFAWQYGRVSVWELGVLTEKVMGEATWKKVRGDVAKKLNLWEDEFTQRLQVVKEGDEYEVLKKWNGDVIVRNDKKEATLTGCVNDLRDRL